jgi:hypothetical protein
MQMLIAGFELLRRLARTFGPYVMLEMLLPGGTLIALLLFIYRRGGLHQEIVLPVTRSCAAFLSAPHRPVSDRHHLRLQPRLGALRLRNSMPSATASG